MSNIQLARGLYLENVFFKKSDALIQEIIKTWQELNLLPHGTNALGRAKQVVYVVRNKDHKIIGITTAYLTKVERLQNHLFAFRGMINPRYNAPGLFIHMTSRTIEFLESIHEKIKPRPIGVIAEIENANLQLFRDVVTPSGLTFIGFSAKGHPLRVYYFDGAKY